VEAESESAFVERAPDQPLGSGVRSPDSGHHPASNRPAYDVRQGRTSGSRWVPEGRLMRG
jgi:hypothetical protein